MSTPLTREAPAELRRVRVARPASPFMAFLWRFARNRLALVGALIIGLMLAAAIFAPLIVKIKEEEFAYLCTTDGKKHYLNVLAKDGSRVWRARLIAKPVSVGFEGERIFVSTDDADVSIFKLK